MKISARNNYTKHQLIVEEKILKTLKAANLAGLTGGLLLREIKEILTNDNPGLKTSRTMIRDIVDDLVGSKQALTVNPENITWRRFREASNTDESPAIDKKTEKWESWVIDEADNHDPDAYLNLPLTPSHRRRRMID